MFWPVAKLAVVASPRVAELLRERRHDLGWSLREVEERTRALGRTIPFSTLAKVEKGCFDPGIRRLHLLFRLYGLGFEVAEELLDLEEFSGDWPVVSDPRAVYDEAVRRWKAGDVRKGLASLLALRAHVPRESTDQADRQKWLLSLAVSVGSLGRFRLSRQIVDELLVEPPVDKLLVPVLVQAAVCWHWLGSGEAALAFLTQAEGHLGESDHQQRAWILHERASTLATLERLEAAEAALEQALVEYKSAEDTYGESRALAVPIRLCASRHDWPGALVAARAARAHAEEHGLARLRTMRTIDEGRLLVKLGETTSGLAALNRGLSEAVAGEDSVCRFYAHYHLWKGYGQGQDAERADVELRNAQYHVQFVDEQTPEVLEVRGTVRGPLRGAAVRGERQRLRARGPVAVRPKKGRAR